MTARVTSALFVSALVRRAFVEGAFAAVVRRGAEEAGAIFVTVEWPDRRVDLYAPAPQTEFGEDTGGRLFQRVLDGVDGAAITARLEREWRFDSDLWVLAIEDREGRSFLDVAPEEPA
ncbi:MAG: DUF1491 family protein [Bauldia sp.]|nr:DUF1491 family protein [Bauldia sp.]